MDDEPPDAVPLEEIHDTDRPILEETHETDELSLKERPCRVPVTIITGFLGAGKTTLVKHILTQPHGYKIAVILNDFGDNLGIEKALVRSDLVVEQQSGSSDEKEEKEEGKEEEGEPVVEEWVEVGNGCICCSVKHSFVLALEQLLERRDRFDYILLETTGLANPGPVISVLWTDEELESPLRLDSVVTVVDGRNILQQLEEDPDGSGTKLAQIQIAFADTVILNKMDTLASDLSKVKLIEDHIRAINGAARVLQTQHCSVDVGQILNSQLFDIKFPEALTASMGESLPSDIGRAVLLDITSVHFVLEGTVDLKKLESWLAELLWEPNAAMKILRMKGAVTVSGKQKVHIFQAVKELFEIKEGHQNAAESQHANRILAVGSGINEDMLRKGFEKCLL